MVRKLKKPLVIFSLTALLLLVRLAGIEPTTPWFVAKYSIQLSYSRVKRNYSTTSTDFGSSGFSQDNRLESISFFAFFFR